MKAAWGPSTCCVCYQIGELTVVVDYRDKQGASTKLMIGPCESCVCARARRGVPDSRERRGAAQTGGI